MTSSPDTSDTDTGVELTENNDGSGCQGASNSRGYRSDQFLLDKKLLFWPPIGGSGDLPDL